MTQQREWSGRPSCRQAQVDSPSTGRDAPRRGGWAPRPPTGSSRRRSRPARRGAPCGRPTAWHRASGRRRSRGPARRPCRRTAPGRSGASRDIRRRRHAVASRGRRAGAARRLGRDPGCRAACGRRGRSADPSDAPSTRTSISLPSTVASTVASKPKAVVRPPTKSRAASRTCSTSTDGLSYGARRALDRPRLVGCAGSAGCSSVMSRPCSRLVGRRVRSLAGSAAARRPASTGRSVGSERGLGWRVGAVVRGDDRAGDPASVAPAPAGREPAPGPPRGSGRTAPAGATSRTSNSASSATTPS